MKKKSPVSTIIILTAFMVLLVFVNPVQGKRYTTFADSDVTQIMVTASRLNVRLGPGTDFPVVSTVKKGEIIDVLGEMGSWYVVHLSDDSIGLLSSDYTQNHSVKQDAVTAFSEASPATEAESMVAMINQARREYGLIELEADPKIMNIAQIKAEDMAEFQYFTHDSPTYGSPFNMLKQLGVTYRSAGENIAGNATANQAQLQIMDSLSHRANVLNPRYTRIGIGVCEDPRYGKIYVQLYVD